MFNFYHIWILIIYQSSIMHTPAELLSRLFQFIFCSSHCGLQPNTWISACIPSHPTVKAKDIVYMKSKDTRNAIFTRTRNCRYFSYCIWDCLENVVLHAQMSHQNTQSRIERLTPSQCLSMFLASEETSSMAPNCLYTPNTQVFYILACFHECCISRALEWMSLIMFECL